MGRLFLNMTFVAGGAYAMLLALVYLGQERMMYLPTATLITTPSAHGMDYEDVYLTASDGVRLHGWFVPVADARGVLLFFHGNAGNVSHRIESIRIFRDLGLSVFIIDYRGYGQSEGSPGEAGLHRDARAAWDHLREVRGYRADRIVVFGRSLGAAVAVQLAAREPPGAVILESAFTSAADLGTEVYPWLPVRTLIRHRHDVRAVLPEVRSPLLIAHSRDDEIVSFDHAHRLLESAPDDTVLLEMEGGHNDGFLRTGPRYLHELDAFIGQALAGTTP